MRRPVLIFTLISILFVGVPLSAQDIELPEYTMEQRWQRLATLTVGWHAAVVALGESQGMTPEEVGTWIGKFFAKSWLGGAEASQFLTGTYRNFMSFPDAEVEVMATTPTSVTARFNRPIDDMVGPVGRIGVPRENIVAMLERVDAVVADWVGVDMERRSEGDYDIVTMETRYGPIRASNDIRWNRSSYLSWLTWLQLMSLRMESGMTAREIGAANAELYKTTWSAPTPWRFFRGMLWNQMTDPGTDCEVLSASSDEVRARCREHYRDLVEQNESRFGVTPEDVFESGRAFAEGVAEHLGLRWTEVLEDGYRVIAVTRR
jgi:hypothetical protein